MIESVKKLKLNVSFVFGDKDWMDSAGAEVVITAKTRGRYADECLS